MRRSVQFSLLTCLSGILFCPSSGITQVRDPEMYARSLRTLAEAVGQMPADGKPIKCGLPVLAAGLRQRNTLLPRESEALSVLLSRPTMETSILIGGFRFHYDTTTSNTPALLNALHQRIPGTARAFIDSAASIMAHVYAFETGDLGFDPPPPDGGLDGPEYDIYVLDLGSSIYGMTNPDIEPTDGGRSSTFIEIHNDFSFVRPDSNKGVPALRVTLAHEFHHAIQIGAYGFWTSDIWFHEMSSVWMEDVVYTEVNDYYNYLPLHFNSPETPFNSNDFIMYARGIWGQYMTKAFGKDAMRTTWEHIRSVPPLQALDDALRVSYNSNFHDAFGDWCAWNAYTGGRSDPVRWYPEGKNYPLIREGVYDLVGGVRTLSGTLDCLGSRYYRIGAGSDTLSLIFVYAGNECGATPAPSYSFTVSRTKLDETFRATNSGLYLKLTLSPAAQWVIWESGAQGPIRPEGVKEGGAYPNPFRPDEQSLLYLPAEATEGTVTIFSQNMELLYSAHQANQVHLGHGVFTWNGRTNSGGKVATGVYVFVLTLPDRMVSGKLVVLRK